MATITSLGASDSGSTSRGTINTNFTNLNTDKIEDDSTDTLTNKTIDANGTGNSITNIETADLASSAKTGLDTKVVTGTAGSDGEVAFWNADGDLDDDGITVTTSEPTATSTDLTIPTSQAVQEALTTQIASAKTMFVPVARGNSGGDAYDASQGDFPFTSITPAQSLYFVFRIPDNFTSLTEAKIVMIPGSTETIQYDISTDYAAVTQSSSTHSESESNTTLAVTSGIVTEADASGVLSSLAAEDYVGVKFTSDTGTLRVIGLYIKYA